MVMKLSSTKLVLVVFAVANSFLTFATANEGTYVITVSHDQLKTISVTQTVLFETMMWLDMTRLN